MNTLFLYFNLYRYRTFHLFQQALGNMRSQMSAVILTPLGTLVKQRFDVTWRQTREGG